MMKYEPLDRNYYYIDKTEKLEQAFEHYRCVYIEGAVACGKTTAVKMYLEKIQKLTEIQVIVLDMNREKDDSSVLLDKISQLRFAAENTVLWVIFENLHAISERQILDALADYFQYLSSKQRCICISREQIPEEFLGLLWNRKMELIQMPDLMLSENEVAYLIEENKSSLSPAETYEITGGWAGSVDMMIRMSKNNRKTVWPGSECLMTPQRLRESFEINTYINKVMLQTLSIEEREIMNRSNVCPWMNASLCHEIWGIMHAEIIMENLTRKGFMIYNGRAEQWRIAPLFKDQKMETDFYCQQREKAEQLGLWYESQGFIKEAINLYIKTNEELLYRKCLIHNFKKIPFQGIPFDGVMNWKEAIPELVYLRGIYCYIKRDFRGLEKEIIRLQGKEFAELRESKESRFLLKEIYINLLYLRPDVKLDDWMEEVHTLYNEEKCSFNLYNIQGSIPTYLCALRDLTELFSCEKKEENRKARLWKEYFGEREWRCYKLAKIDYYFETERYDSISQEDDEFLREEKSIEVLYLLIKLQSWQYKKERQQQIEDLEAVLFTHPDKTVVETSKLLMNLYSFWMKSPEKLIRWIRYSENKIDEITEENYVYAVCLSKGFFLIQQYDKAMKIIELLIFYEKDFRRGRMLAEHLYQLAIIKWEEDHHGQALQFMIESFLISKYSRYVGFYASYGKRGIEVLESYIQWMQANTPEGWHRKKKYQYGNVLKMPEADYMGVIVRCIKRQSRNNQLFQKTSRQERFTMMERIILQDISLGLTNAEICENLNLKLPTIKTHIYSLYKKLGVNTRVQAIIRGKELGLLE